MEPRIQYAQTADGVSIALCREKCAGVYIVPSLGRFDLVAELVAEIKSRHAAQHGRNVGLYPTAVGRHPIDGYAGTVVPL